MSAEAKRRQEEQGKLVDDEQRGRGRIPLKTYQFFLAAFGVGVLIISTVSALLFEGSQVYSLFWLADWSTTSGDEAKFVGVYAAINMFAVLMSTSQGMAVAQGCSNAAISLHARLLEVILLRPTDFFVRAVYGTRVRSTAACVLTSACGLLCVAVCVAVCVWLCVVLCAGHHSHRPGHHSIREGHDGCGHGAWAHRRHGCRCPIQSRPRAHHDGHRYQGGCP